MRSLASCFDVEVEGDLLAAANAFRVVHLAIYVCDTGDPLPSICQMQGINVWIRVLPAGRVISLCSDFGLRHLSEWLTTLRRVKSNSQLQTSATAEIKVVPTGSAVDDQR